MIVDSQFRLVRLLRHYSVDEFDDLLIQIITFSKLAILIAIKCCKSWGFFVNGSAADTTTITPSIRSIFDNIVIINS